MGKETCLEAEGGLDMDEKGGGSMRPEVLHVVLSSPLHVADSPPCRPTSSYQLHCDIVLRLYT
jgi:hypothetical protein